MQGRSDRVRPSHTNFDLRRRGNLRSLLRLGTLLLLVVVLEAAIFLPYFTGAKIPPWDFLGSYNTAAFLWWSEGSFFRPMDWVPSSLAGYPAALMLQGSSWYLPVGFFAVFGPFTLHSSAVVSALHVAFGFCGTYALTRSFRLPFSVAAFAAVAGFFAVGYFSNAQHVDIVRAYAWTPWLFLVLSPRWPWQKIWSVPLAALMLWQAVTGMYPGMIFATVYVGVVWVAVFQWQDRPGFRSFLGPLSIATTAATLLCAPRLLPYMLLASDTAGDLPETSKFDVAMIGTLLFGYGDPGGFPNDISMNSFFLPATVLALCWFADYGQRISRLGLAVGIPAFALGMPFLPWFGLTQSWPGLGLSRFTMSDFKVFILLAVVLLACSGMQCLLKGAPMESTAFWTRFSGALALSIILLTVGISGPYTPWNWLPGFALLLLVLALILSCRFIWSSKRAIVLPIGVLVFTISSGALWAHTTQSPWGVSRISAEIETFGLSVDELISMRPVTAHEVQRPARNPLPNGYDYGMIFSPGWNSSYYTGQDAVGGYVNVKGSETVSRLTESLIDPNSGTAFAEFLAAPGRLLSAEASPENLRACAKSAACGDAAIVPTGYAAGYFKYQVSAANSTTAVLNEAYYAGWAAQACYVDGCKNLDSSRSADGLIQVSLPEGNYALQVQYHAPGRAVGWVVFATGVAVLIFGMLIRRKSGWRTDMDRGC